MSDKAFNKMDTLYLSNPPDNDLNLSFLDTA